MRRPIVARSVLGEKVCIGVFSRDVGWQRVASFLFFLDCRLCSDCRIVGVYPVLWVPVSATLNVMLGFTFVAMSLLRNMSVFDCLKYDGYGNSRIPE